MKEFPRVLVVTTEPFGGNTSSSFTLASLFKGWPKDRLAQVYVKDRRPDFDLCSHYWMRSRSLLRDGDVVSQSSLPTEDIPDGASRKPRSRVVLPSGMKRLLAFFYDLLPRKTASPEFRRWLEEFNPDLVYSWLASNQQMALVRAICEISQIPLVPHFMDDWLMSNLAVPFVSAIQAFTFRRSMARLLPHCPEGLGISPAMAAEYQIRLGIPMSHASNGVGAGLLEQLRTGAGERKINDGKFRITVLGRLEYGRLRLLRNLFAACQSKIKSTSGLVFSINSNSPPPEGFSCTKSVEVEWHAAPTNTELLALQTKTDCVLYLDSFDDFSHRYFRLSFSGKIPICLALSRPIITIGPGSLNSVEYLRGCNVGPVVTTSDKEAMVEAVADVLSWGSGKREEVGLRALKCAYRDHSSDVQSKRLREVLFRCARRVIV